MKLLLALGAVACGAVALTGSALASAPVLVSVIVGADRHPAAEFAAPKADSVAIYFASKPDRATDGAFLDENVVTTDILTTDEIRAGRWSYESQLDPGTYYVMLDASADLDLCPIDATGAVDPSCADGYSNVATLTVPTPRIRYSARATLVSYLHQVDLTLTASPLGTKQSYRVCYVTKAAARVCLAGSLVGYSWDSATSDQLTAPTRKLGRQTTFTWYVGSRAVVSKRVTIARR